MMKIANYKLINYLIPALNELAGLRTGAKISYAVAYTLKKATEVTEILDTVNQALNLRYEAEKEAVEKEWSDLLLQESEFDSRAISFEALESIIDGDKLTASLVLKLGDFIIQE